MVVWVGLLNCYFPSIATNPHASYSWDWDRRIRITTHFDIVARQSIIDWKLLFVYYTLFLWCSKWGIRTGSWWEGSTGIWFEEPMDLPILVEPSSFWRIYSNLGSQIYPRDSSLPRSNLGWDRGGWDTMPSWPSPANIMWSRSLFPRWESRGVPWWWSSKPAIL